jgi:hypothetical protein
MVDHHHRAGRAGRDERRRRDARRSDGEVSGGVGKGEPRRSRSRDRGSARSGVSRSRGRGGVRRERRSGKRLLLILERER